jgi:hypothetical protein
MEFHVEAGPKTKRFIEHMLPSMLDQLGLTNCKKFLMIKMDPELEDMGSTVPMPGIDTYLVVIKPTRSFHTLGSTLAHELVHVRQLARGVLKITPRGRTWQGRFYSQKTPYLQQPWEIQAFAQQELVFRRAID